MPHDPIPARWAAAPFRPARRCCRPSFSRSGVGRGEWGQKFGRLFEGRDAAGRGGTTTRFTDHLNPRFAPLRGA
ncbi:hypothetical protein [Alterinioella nitratireducens]|uniref:hypothetical protein n=1 Tax=Alterinioella nitratireducens TaxID=2735915 RepID=UPI002E2A0DC1|nr:hypothetical protein [Alterinioella nitratireducens]